MNLLLEKLNSAPIFPQCYVIIFQDLGVIECIQLSHHTAPVRLLSIHRLVNRHQCVDTEFIHNHRNGCFEVFFSQPEIYMYFHHLLILNLLLVCLSIYLNLNLPPFLQHFLHLTLKSKNNS